MKPALLFLAMVVSFTALCAAQVDTRWKIHDLDRPLPPVIDPGTASNEDAPGRPPSDAVVLFDGKDLSKWEHNGGKDVTWAVENGVFHRPVRPNPGGGDIFTRQKFGDCQLHVEFSEPTPARGSGQGRGNSGIFFHEGTYEIQVLDCYGNETYADGSTASIYGQYPPLVNACRKPGEWQTYDILWTSPRWTDGKLAAPAYVTVFHNGVVVHNHTAVLGPCMHRQALPYTPHAVKGKIGLQDHGGDVVRFRNVWVRDLKDYDQQPLPGA